MIFDPHSLLVGSKQLNGSRGHLTTVREYFLTFFFKMQKNVTFHVSEVTCQKHRKQKNVDRFRVTTLDTRKLCYRKDDRAMRPIHGCPENFRDSLTMPTATIPNIFHEILFGSTLWMFLPNLKSVALSVPEIIGVPKKFGQPVDTPSPHTPFSPKFLTGFYSEWPCKYIPQIWSP